MRFDTVIIGGGLAGLMCAISLQKGGQRCAVVSAGQSALHFSSGSFDLLNRLPDGSEVRHPADAVPLLAESHPYRKLDGCFGEYAGRAKRVLEECGISVNGDFSMNHFRYTPMGTLKPTWLTLSEFAVSQAEDLPLQGKVLVANFAGFLDFNAKFIADAMTGAGADCYLATLNVPAVDRLRKSPTEMRASNIARTLEDKEVFDVFLEVLKEKAEGYDKIVLPAVFGLGNGNVSLLMKKMMSGKVLMLPTMPPSVPGIRTQMILRRAFEHLGGVYLLGDTVREAVVEDRHVKAVYTDNHAESPFEADCFVLATGHFFSGGLVADMDSVREPVFGCDVDYVKRRDKWYEEEPFGDHRYFRFGVSCGNDFRAGKDGVPYDNLYAAGSVLGGADSRIEGSGAGVSMLTALRVADLILESF